MIPKILIQIRDGKITECFASGHLEVWIDLPNELPGVHRLEVKEIELAKLEAEIEARVN